MLYGKNIIVGGSDLRFPLFRRREKVQEQEQLIAEFTAKLNDLRDKKNHCAAEVARLRADSSALASAAEQTIEETAIAQKTLSELDFQRRTLTSELDRWNSERTQISGRIESLRNRQYTLGLGSTELLGLKNQLVNDISHAITQLDDYEKAVSETLERVAKLQVASVEARSRVEQTESKIGHLREIAKDIAETLDKKKFEIEQATQTIAESNSIVGTLELELKQEFERREELQRDQESVRERQAEAQTRTSSKEKLIKEIRERRDTVNEQAHTLDIRLNTVDSESKGLSEKLLDEYQVDVVSIEVPCPDAEMSEEQARDYLHQQKDLLRKFGAVNLLALEEYRTTSEREKFLDEQLADLTSARDDLQTTIAKINQTAKQLFMETFAKAKDNFKALFQELFSGGEADITLENPDDPLESNIDIIARPRGKKLLSITMMSGGERALTAISLLFALYLVKPSPFCILDEIDAPLDDANCHRFLKIIRKFSNQTQFITITHNKITMEAADNLYGITMEQPGVSKLVAVKFTDTRGEGNSEVTVDTDDNLVAAELPDDSQLPASIQERLNPGVTITDDNDN